MSKCDFCDSSFSSTRALKHHQKTAKYCIKLQGKTSKLFKCKHCDKILSTNQNLKVHKSNCVKYIQFNNNELWLEEKKQIINDYEKQKQNILEDIANNSDPIVPPGIYPAGNPSGCAQAGT